jgi:hypothetical protein
MSAYFSEMRAIFFSMSIKFFTTFHKLHPKHEFFLFQKVKTWLWRKFHPYYIKTNQKLNTITKSYKSNVNRHEGDGILSMKQKRITMKVHNLKQISSLLIYSDFKCFSSTIWVAHKTISSILNPFFLRWMDEILFRKRFQISTRYEMLQWTSWNSLQVSKFEWQDIAWMLSDRIIICTT